MKKHDFYFDLPQHLIAQHPLPNRTDSRLLVYQRKSGQCRHQHFPDLLSFLEEGDLLVMNNTRVIRARLFGAKRTGGRVEVLVERLIDERRFLAQIRASKTPKVGTIIVLERNFENTNDPKQVVNSSSVSTEMLLSEWNITVQEKTGDMYLCEANGSVEALLEQMGHIPLPPYIQRADGESDEERYQTVFAEHKGSVAAPTAGLHFDHVLLAKLEDKGIKIAFTTLHVGAGTFQPVRSEHIIDHKMHSEQYMIAESLVTAIAKTRACGKRIIAVGTTALRSLESAAQRGAIIPGCFETDIFIYPGYQFKICDGLITNFHLPESTLLMLVSAFIGHQQTMALYREAIAKTYRFFSYGDACLLL